MDKKREEIIKLLPKEIRKLFMMSEIDFSRLQEIRLRKGTPTDKEGDGLYKQLFKICNLRTR